MRSLRIVHRPRRGMEESRFHTYRWRRVYRRAPDECAVPPLDIGIRAIQLSPYRAGVAGPCHTRLLTSPAFQPCCCSLALSGLGEAVASESSALNSGLLRRQFLPCVTWRTVSLHAAQALPTPLAERGAATSNTDCDTTFTIRAWSPRTVIRRESAPVSVATAVICLLSSGGWPNSLVMQDQMDVSTLSRRVMSPVGSTLIHSITEWPSLLPSSPSRTSIGLPYGLLSLTGDVRGYHVPSQSHTDGLGALCPPVACDAHDKEARSPCTRSSALLAQAFQHLWLVFCDDVYRAFTWVRHTIHPRPSPSWC